MIISKCPLRICLAGGGTDLPSFYQYTGVGKTISMAIDKYVYILINSIYSDTHIIKYSNIEKKEHFHDIQHPIIREVLKRYLQVDSKIELVSVSDVPGGTGLGSSGAFTTALIHGIRSFMNEKIDINEICASACDIEINVLQSSCGKQDQFISGFGGLRELIYYDNGNVDVKDLNIKSSVMDKFLSRLVMVYTGLRRDASDNLKVQDTETLRGNQDMINRMQSVFDQNELVKNILINDQLDDYADLMNQHWSEKKTRSPGMTLEYIDNLISFGLKNGANGAKLIGAGGGGFILFYSKDRRKLTKELFKKFGVREFKFDIDNHGLVSL